MAEWQAVDGARVKRLSEKLREGASDANPGSAQNLETAAQRSPVAGLKRQAGDTPVRTCCNCATTETPLWRGNYCNACAVYKKNHQGEERPLDMVSRPKHLKKGRVDRAAPSDDSKTERAPVLKPGRKKQRFTASPIEAAVTTKNTLAEDSDDDVLAEPIFPLQVRSSYCSGPKAQVITSDTMATDEPTTPVVKPSVPLSSAMFTSLWGDEDLYEESPFALSPSEGSASPSSNWSSVVSDTSSENNKSEPHYFESLRTKIVKDETQLPAPKEVEDWLQDVLSPVSAIPVSA